MCLYPCVQGQAISYINFVIEEAFFSRVALENIIWNEITHSGIENMQLGISVL